MATIPAGAKITFFDPHRRFTQAEVDAFMAPIYCGEPPPFIKVQRVEEAEACFVLDPACFNQSFLLSRNDRN